MRSLRILRRGHPPILGWTSLAVLILLVKLGAADETYCRQLTPNSAKETWLTCEYNPLKLNDNYKETEYLVDISDFTKEDFDQFTLLKGNKVQQSSRIIEANFTCSNSTLEVIENIIVNNSRNAPQYVILDSNLRLKTLKFGENNSTVGKIKFTVTNNKLLSQESIDALESIDNKTDDSYIQNFGECEIRSGSLKSFGDLEDCRYIKGDLSMDRNTGITDKFPETLTEIRGCIQIKNTKLKNLYFLERIKNTTCATTHEVVDNGELCLHPETVFNFTNKFKNINDNKIKFENNNQCRGICSWKYLRTSKDHKCLIVEGDVTLEKSQDSDNFTHLSQVEEIHGRIVIQVTDLTQINMFPRLKKIKLDIMNSAIYIFRNKNLTSFEFPALKEIEMNGGNARVIVMEENNPDFVVEDEQYEWLKNLTGNMLLVPWKAPPLPVYEVESNATNAEKVEKPAKVNEDNSKSLALGLGIPSAVILIIIVVGAIIGAILGVRRVKARRRAKKEEDEKRKKREAHEAKIREKLTHADVADFSSIDASSLSSCRQNECATSSQSSKKGDSDNTICTDAGDKNELPFEIGEFLSEADKEFKRGNLKFNLECTRMTVQNFMEIKRQHLEKEKFRGKENPSETSEEIKKIWIHKMKYQLFTIRPRLENTTESMFEKTKVVTFDPDRFIEKCMESSSVRLSKSTLIAALEYCLKTTPVPPHALIHVTGPVHIVGDTHGSLMDLQAVLSLDPLLHFIKGSHPILEYKYLFTGDYLDRGIYDYVCFTFLCVLAARFPKRFYLLRGNHEFMRFTSEQNHLSNLERLYGVTSADEIDEMMSDLCSRMPIAAVVDKRIFACHGGISRSFVDNMKKLKDDKNNNVSKLFEGFVFPLVHSSEFRKQAREAGDAVDRLKEKLDPSKNKRFGDDEEDSINELKKKKRKRAGKRSREKRVTPDIPKKDPTKILKEKLEKAEKHRKNLYDSKTTANLLLWSDPAPISFPGSNRHVGHNFNYNDVKEFLEFFDMDLIVRGHEAVGFNHTFGGRLITLFAQFEDDSNKVGFPYVFSDEEIFPKLLRKLPQLPSLGVLRVDSTGCLTMMMLRHAYLDDDVKLEKGSEHSKRN